MRHITKAILFMFMTGAFLVLSQNATEAGREQGSIKSRHQGLQAGSGAYREMQPRDLGSKTQPQRIEAGAPQQVEPAVGAQDRNKAGVASPVVSEEQDCGCDEDVRREWAEMMRKASQ